MLITSCISSSLYYDLPLLPLLLSHTSGLSLSLFPSLPWIVLITIQHALASLILKKYVHWPTYTIIYCPSISQAISWLAFTTCLYTVSLLFHFAFIPPSTLCNVASSSAEFALFSLRRTTSVPKSMKISVSSYPVLSGSNMSNHSSFLTLSSFGL